MLDSIWTEVLLQRAKMMETWMTTGYGLPVHQLVLELRAGHLKVTR